MRPNQARFVTGCQQVLALGAVLAVLTPAASVLNLDVVGEMPPRAHHREHAVAGLSAYTREAQRPSLVPTAPVDAKIRTYDMTAPATGLSRTKAAKAPLATSRRTLSDGDTQVLTRPLPVPGFGGVGITWDPTRTTIPESDIDFEVRTRTDGTWSAWQTLDYSPEHGPDPGSAEARHARPGTDITFVGDVGRVQVRSTGSLFPPAGMQLSVVTPGAPVASKMEAPAINTAQIDGDPANDALTLTTDQSSDTLLKRRNALATYTPKPVIYSRAQWGADERLRDKSSLHYYEVHAGFVHHTVNANGYTRAEVPGLLRGIYAYHTQSRGWSDVGYNFLVDRFGRIWEGRYGGVDRPVVGAHTLGYNDDSFAMSAIGNYDIKRPSAAMVQAYGSLFAWKLSLHGVDASSTRQYVTSRYFEAINGHRDAGQTACPGRYLYAKIPKIRRLAEADQQGWAGRELQSNIAGSPYPDLIVRRARDGRGFILPTGGLSGFSNATRTKGFYTGTDTVVASPDLTGDGIGDLLVRTTDGETTVRPGDGVGHFGTGIRPTDAFASQELLTAVGDVNGDGRADVVARSRTGALGLYEGNGSGGFNRVRVPGDWSGYDLFAGTGDVNGDGHADLLARDEAGHLYRFPGATDGFGSPVQVPGTWSQWETITGFGDYSGDGRPDLFVKTADGPGRVLPGRGHGTYGAALGPYTRFKRYSDIAGSGQMLGDEMPDVVARRGDSLLVVPNNGTFDLGRRMRTNLRLADSDAVFNAGDWNRDGYSDVISRERATGDLYLHPGTGGRKFGPAEKIASGFDDVRLLAAVGDMTGDGYPDLMGQPSGGSMRLYPGEGDRGLGASYVAHSAISASSQISVGRWDDDGAPDSLLRQGRRLALYPGNGPGGLMNKKSLSLNVKRYDWVVGVSDLSSGGHPDLVVRQASNGRLYAITATASGFGHRRLLGEGMSIYDLAG